MLQSFAQYVILQPNELAGEAVGDKQSEFDINCKIDGKIAKLPDDTASLTPAEMRGKFFLYTSDKDNQDFVIELTKRTMREAHANDAHQLAPKKTLRRHMLLRAHYSA